MSQNIALLQTQGLNDTSPDIGVSSAAAGQYKCVARNVNETMNETVMIEVNEIKEGKFVTRPIHLHNMHSPLMIEGQRLALKMNIF